MLQHSRNTFIQIKQNIFELKALFYIQQLYIYSAEGIVFIQLQGNGILVNCQGNIDSFKEHIFIHKKYNHSRQLYSDTKLYSFQGTVSVRSRKYILVQRNIFIHGNYIHSSKYSYLRNIYSFKFKAICSFKETIFTEHCCIRGIAEIFIQKLSLPLYDNYKLYNYYLLNKV